MMEAAGTEFGGGRFRIAPFGDRERNEFEAID